MYVYELIITDHKATNCFLSIDFQVNIMSLSR